MSKPTAEWYLAYCRRQLDNLPADANARGVGYWRGRIEYCLNILFPVV